MRFFRALIAAALVLAPLNAAFAQDGPRIIAVNQALQYMAARLVDGSADVVFPVPEGVDPSFWRPSIADISAVQAGDLILLNGAGFATWIDRVSLPRARLVDTSAGIRDQFIVTETITHSHGDGGEHSHEGLASYLWLDPLLAIAQAEAIATALIARDLVPQSQVEARLTDIRADMSALDARVQTALSNLEGLEIIATHPRYQYFARRYNLSITALDWDVGAMPTPEQLANLDRLAAQQGAQVLIWEAQPLPEAVQAIEALGLQSVVFEPWARKGVDGTFLAAYETAVSAIVSAVGQSSN